MNASSLQLRGTDPHFDGKAFLQFIVENFKLSTNLLKLDNVIRPVLKIGSLHGINWTFKLSKIIQYSTEHKCQCTALHTFTGGVFFPVNIRIC